MVTACTVGKTFSVKWLKRLVSAHFPTNLSVLWSNCCAKLERHILRQNRLSSQTIKPNWPLTLTLNHYPDSPLVHHPIARSIVMCHRYIVLYRVHLDFLLSQARGFLKQKVIVPLCQWCLRRILDIRWYHRVSNHEVRRMTEQPPLTDIIQKRRLMLFGHVARMDETADARRILIRAIGVGQLGAPTPPGWPLWRATYLCTILPSRML